MHARVEDWPENRFAVRLALTAEEIEPLLSNLRALRRDTSQHFHLSADGPEAERLGDIEISVAGPGEKHNMSMTRLALAPGTEVPDPEPRRSRWRMGSPRSGAAAVLGVAGVVELLDATASAYVTYATADYRPMLIQGAWRAALALLAFQVSGVMARGWKARVVALAGALAVLVPLSGILGRLGALR